MSYSPRRYIAESTILPIDQISKFVDENAGVAGFLSNSIKIDDLHPKTTIRFTLNVFPCMVNHLRLQWYQVFSSTEHDVSSLAAQLKNNEAVILKKITDLLSPWSPRITNSATEPNSVVVQFKSDKVKVATNITIYSETNPDKFSQDDKEAVSRIQYILLKMAMERPVEFFFGPYESIEAKDETAAVE